MSDHLNLEIFLKTLLEMSCNCQHCIELKKQLDRAEKRQAALFKERSSKLVIR